jgi:hypothetical protein
MTLGSKENYINAAATKHETSFHRLDCWRGLPNNRLWDPAGIPDFHPRICAWGWCLICRLPWTPISVVPTLTTTETWSHNTSVLYIIVPLRWRRCRSRRLEVGALNLSLRRLKSLARSVTPQNFKFWNVTKIH